MELLAGMVGTARALGQDMAQRKPVHADQIATRTDPLLRTVRRRVSANKIVYRPAFAIELARPTVVQPEIVRRQPELPDPCERTVFVRAPHIGASTASAALLASLFAVALVAASVY